MGGTGLAEWNFLDSSPGDERQVLKAGKAFIDGDGNAPLQFTSMLAQKRCNQINQLPGLKSLDSNANDRWLRRSTQGQKCVKVRVQRQNDRACLGCERKNCRVRTPASNTSVTCRASKPASRKSEAAVRGNPSSRRSLSVPAPVQ